MDILPQESFDRPKWTSEERAAFETEKAEKARIYTEPVFEARQLIKAQYQEVAEIVSEGEESRNLKASKSLELLEKIVATTDEHPAARVKAFEGFTKLLKTDGRNEDVAEDMLFALAVETDPKVKEFFLGIFAHSADPERFPKLFEAKLRETDIDRVSSYDEDMRKVNGLVTALKKLSLRPDIDQELRYYIDLAVRYNFGRNIDIPELRPNMDTAEQATAEQAVTAFGKEEWQRLNDIKDIGQLALYLAALYERTPEPTGLPDLSQEKLTFRTLTDDAERTATGAPSTGVPDVKVKLPPGYVPSPEKEAEARRTQWLLHTLVGVERDKQLFLCTMPKELAETYREELRSVLAARHGRSELRLAIDQKYKKLLWELLDEKARQVLGSLENITLKNETIRDVPAKELGGFGVIDAVVRDGKVVATYQKLSVA